MAESLALRRQSLADQVAHAVLSMILDDGLGAGDTLPSTAVLAERFDVSRTVVREALADLAGRGIIERSQGRESVVATPGSQQLRELFDFRIRRDAIEPSSLSELRQSVELLSARLAATRASDEEIDELAQILERMAASKNRDEFHETDIAFHRALARASGNPLVSLVLDAVVQLMRDFRQRWFKGHQVRGRTREVIIDEHRKIFTAVKRRNPAKAAAAMATHLQASPADLDGAER